MQYRSLLMCTVTTFQRIKEVIWTRFSFEFARDIFLISSPPLFSQTVKQMWPFICQFLDKLFRETIEPAVKGANPHLSTFCFTKIDMGDKVMRQLLLLYCSTLHTEVHLVTDSFSADSQLSETFLMSSGFTGIFFFPLAGYLLNKDKTDK